MFISPLCPVRYLFPQILFQLSLSLRAPDRWIERERERFGCAITPALTKKMLVFVNRNPGPNGTNRAMLFGPDPVMDLLWWSKYSPVVYWLIAPWAVIIPSLWNLLNSKESQVTTAPLLCRSQIPEGAELTEQIRTEMNPEFVVRCLSAQVEFIWTGYGRLCIFF